MVKKSQSQKLSYPTIFDLSIKILLTTQLNKLLHFGSASHSPEGGFTLLLFEMKVFDRFKVYFLNIFSTLTLGMNTLETQKKVFLFVHEKTSILFKSKKLNLLC